MQYLLMIYSDESGMADATPEDGARMMAAYGAFDQRGQGGRRVRGRRRPAADVDGDDRARARRRAAAHRRAVRRDARAARRLLPARVRRPRRGDRAGRPRSRAPCTARSRSARSWTTRPRAPGSRRRSGGARLTQSPDVLDRLFRRESAQAVAALARALGDLDRAEEAVQDAYATALERWPRDGVPANPAAWIVTAARNRALDRIRAERRSAPGAPRRRRGWRRSARDGDAGRRRDREPDRPTSGCA